jgi:hypothetical protein
MFRALVVASIAIVASSGALHREIRLPEAVVLAVQELLIVAVITAGFFGRWDGNRLPRQVGYLLAVWCVLVTLIIGELPLLVSMQALRVAVFPVLFGLALMRLPRTDPDVLIRGVVLAAIPGAVLGTRQAVFGFSGAELEVLTTAEATYIVGDSFRLIGGVGTGQEFAMLIMLAAVCSIWRMAHGKTSAIWGSVASAWYSVLVVLCLQRIAVAAFAIALIVMLLLKQDGARTVRRIAFQVGPLMALAGIAAVMSGLSRLNDVASRMGTFFSLGTDESLDIRLEVLWPRVVGLIAERPMTGWGGGSAGVTSVRHSQELTNGVVIADNMLLHFAVQFGLVGSGLGLLFIMVLWVRSSDPSGTLGRSLIAGTAVAGITGTVLGLYGYMIQVMAVVAVCATAPLLDSENTESIVRADAR